MILTLITVGKMLEAYSKGKNNECIKEPDAACSKKSNDLRDGEEVSVPVEQVQIGDNFCCSSGRERSGGRCDH